MEKKQVEIASEITFLKLWTEDLISGTNDDDNEKKDQTAQDCSRMWYLKKLVFKLVYKWKQ